MLKLGQTAEIIAGGGKLGLEEELADGENLGRMNWRAGVDARFQSFNKLPDVSLMFFSGHADRTLTRLKKGTTVRLRAHLLLRCDRIKGQKENAPGWLAGAL